MVRRSRASVVHRHRHGNRHRCVLFLLLVAAGGAHGGWSLFGRTDEESAAAAGAGVPGEAAGDWAGEAAGGWGWGGFGGGDSGSLGTPPPHMRFAMITFSNLGSAEMRGHMIALALNQLPHTSAEVARFDGKKGSWQAPWIVPPDVCVCVKRCSDVVAEECRRQGAVVVWDVIDSREVYEKGYAAEHASKKVDGYFVNNGEYKRLLNTRWLPGVPVEVMHHQHTNVACTSIDGAWEPKIVVLLGAPENYPDPAVVGIFKNMVEGMGLRWLTETEAREKVAESPGVLEACVEGLGPEYQPVCKQLVFHKVLQQASLAIIWPKDVYSEFETQLRPVTRLVTAWSHGIPTAFFPFRSYAEAALALASSASPSMQGVNPAFLGLASTFHEVAAFLEMMVDDPQWRLTLSRHLVEEASKYSTVSIAGRYPVEICKMFKETTATSGWSLASLLPEDCEAYQLGFDGTPAAPSTALAPQLC